MRDALTARRPHVLLGCAVLGLGLSPLGLGACALAALAVAIAFAAVLEASADRAGSAGEAGSAGAAGSAREAGSAGEVAIGGRLGVGPLLDELSPRARARFVLGAAGIVLLAGLLGCWRLAAIDAPARAAPAGSFIDATATLLEPPRAGSFGSSAPMRVETGPAAGLRVLVRSRERAWPHGEPGTRFRLRGLVKPPRASPVIRSLFGIAITEANAGKPGTPGYGPLPAKPADDFDYAAFLRSRGIAREVQADSLTAIGHRGGLEGAVDSIRRRADAGISAHLDPGRAALARGMVLGEDGDVAPETRDDFQRAGLAHLLAASGQNVALMCALALPLLMLAGAAVRLRVAVLLPLVALYVLLAGSGASITRAGIMAAAGLIAVAAGRRASAVYALLLAAAATLALNPRTPGDPGWQLSFAAVIGMLALGPPLQRRMSGLPRPASEALAATAAATIATAPLLAHDFGTVSLAALPANVLAFPAVAPIMWIGMAEATVEQLGALGHPLAALAHAGEAVVAPVTEIALRWVAWVARQFADRGWAQAKLHVGWLATLLAYTAIAAVAIGIRKGHRPALAPSRIRMLAGDLGDWIRAAQPATRRALAAPLAALALAAAARAAEPAPPPRGITVDFIDVGQGDSTLIRDSTGAALLFDGGVPEARVDRTLARLGVRRLSVVVATHQSRDHTGGLMQVVRRFPVGLFLDGRYGVRDPSFVALEHEVDRRRIPRRPTRRGEHLRVGTMTVDILWPPPRGGAPPPADPNTRATVAIVREGAFSLLLSADAEAPVLLPLRLPQVDAMKVPHHGSAEDGLPQLLARLRPRVAAIECGRGNPFAHPRPPTLAALRRVPRVYRTDRDGTIELSVRDGSIAIRTHR